MYQMYVDESGDPGLSGSPTRYFVLSGLVVHESRWRESLDRLIDFRRRMARTFGLRLSDEIHAAALINRPGELVRIPRNERLTLVRFFADELATMSYLNVINIVVDKNDKPVTYDPFVMAWKTLLQRFSNTLTHGNFPDSSSQRENGMVFPDQTDMKKVTQLMRQMGRFNPVPNQPAFGLGYRNLTITNIVEDPSFRDSAHSYFIQAADLVAFLLYQKIAPNAYVRRKSAQNYFDRLTPILCRVASNSDRQGIVRL
jgi:hypothetical protein